MTRARIEALQWFGLLAGPLAWACHLVLGTFFNEAHCEASRWVAGWSSGEIAITVVAVLVAVAGEAAAVTVFRVRRRVDHDAAGPPGRQQFFAVGGMVGNVLFTVAILLTGVTVVSTNGCRPA